MHISDNISSRTHARTRTRTLYVLIACEESQAECLAFRQLGHIAYSCDIQPCRRTGNPSWHIQGDVTPYLAGKTDGVTQSGVQFNVPRWDLVIAHPPCTYLCKVSSVHMVINGVVQPERYRLMQQARDFFMKCIDAAAPFVAVENPIPMARAQLPRPSCYIQPSWFGVKYTKKTLYWLKNLPPIMPELEYPNPKEFVRASRGKYRSRTFPQVAQALARQWSDYITKYYNLTFMKEKEPKRSNPEAYDCLNCLNYEWFDDEVGYQCRYCFNPPCESPVWPTD